MRLHDVKSITPDGLVLMDDGRGGVESGRLVVDERGMLGVRGLKDGDEGRLAQVQSPGIDLSGIDQLS